MKQLFFRNLVEVRDLVRHAELHEGPFSGTKYLSFLDHLRILAKSHDFEWGVQLEQALVLWQTHRMFGDLFADPASNQEVLASGIFDLPPKTKVESKSFQSREAVATAITEAMFACGDEFTPCHSPTSELAGGKWWCHKGLIELYVFFDIPRRGRPTAYPSIVVPEPLSQIDVGLTFSELVFDRDECIGRPREAAKALCRFCQLLASIGKPA